MRRLAIGALPLLVLAGCANLGEPLAADDGGAGQDASAGLVPGPEFDADRAGAVACFDGIDNDADGAFDCGDPSCQANLPSCCVGATSAICCAEGAPSSLVIDACAGPLAGCGAAEGYDVFGAPGPTVLADGDARAVVPGGADDRDAGAVRLEPLDPRRGAVVVEARIASGAAGGADGAESLALGLVDALTPASSLGRVSPVVGFVIARNRDQVRLVVRDEVVAEAPLPDTLTHLYRLRVEPGGAVTLTIDPGVEGETQLVAGAQLDGPVRLAFWGRTPTGAQEPPRFTSLQVVQEQCDMPRALDPGAVVVPAPTDPDPTWRVERRSLARPHVLRWTDAGVARERMALVVDGAIHLAEPGEGGYVDAIGAPVVAPIDAAWGDAGVSYPRLRAVDGELELWLTAYDDRGHGTIARARWDAAASRFGAPEPVPGLIGDGDASFEAAAPYEDGTGVLLVALRRTIDGRGAIALYEPSETGPATLVAEVRAPAADLLAFDRDEVDAPAVAKAGRVYRMFFAGRRGNRWSLGLLVSDDGRSFHDPLGGPLSEPPGQGFDALGRRDPAPLVEGETLTLFYAGTDGIRTRVGALHGRLP